VRGGLRRDDVVIVEQEMQFPRSHPAPMETCGAVAAFDRVSGKLTVWCTTQAPHAHRTLYSLVTGLPEHRIRVISPDVGGGFGNKVPVYPGYICAIAAARLLGRPVKWMEDRSENLMSTGFARDFVMKGGSRRRATAGCWPSRRRHRRPRRVQRHRAADALPGRVLQRLHRLLRRRGRALRASPASTPTRRPAGWRTRARSGSPRRSTSSSAGRLLARELGIDPVELRLANLIRPEQFPYASKTGWVYDSATTRRRCARRWSWPATTSCARSRPSGGRAAS
jgi:carbon-monoxide dehydrogenase large subunit